MNADAAATAVAICLGLANLGYLIWKDKGKEVWALADRLSLIEQSRVEFRDKIFKHVDRKCEESVLQFGETMKAQMEHTRLLELDLYKNFVRIDTFKETMNSFSISMTERLGHIEKRFDRLEEILRKP
jgi:hypothetical protein